MSVINVGFKHGEQIKDTSERFLIQSKMIEEVKKIYPNAKLCKEIYKNCFNFCSKDVNLNYTDVNFTSYGGLWVHPYHKIDISFENKDYSIFVKTTPQKVCLIKYDYDHKSSRLMLTFPATKKNLKKHKFDHKKLFNDCKYKILEYVRNSTTKEVDLAKADPSIQELLNIM